jgi:putative ABC transport system ATP-binding protein
VRTLLQRLCLKDRADHRPDALSGGEQQRVAIARALLFEPAVLLADEPTGALDSASSQRLWQLLRELAQQQRMTIVMVTHEPAAAVHCKRVVVLGDGRTRGEFEVDGIDAGDLALRYQQLGG